MTPAAGGGQPASPAMRRYSVLAGLKVIELGQVVAAPHCGLLLAAAGADVIKVERPPATIPGRTRPSTLG